MNRRRNVCAPLLMAGMLLSLAADARAADVLWNGLGADNRWDNGLNWSSTLPPTSADRAIAEDDTSPIIVDIDGATAAIANIVYLASSDASTVTVHMTGGTLDALNHVLVGRNGKATVNLSGGGVITTPVMFLASEPGGNPRGIVNVNGGALNTGFLLVGNGGILASAFSELNLSNGTVTAQNVLVGDEAYAQGRITMTGGKMTVTNIAILSNDGVSLKGEFHLDGGTLTVIGATPASQSLTAYPPKGLRLGNLAGNVGFFDITGGGKLLLSGDATAAVQNYIDADLLTGNANTASFNNDLMFDLRRNPGFTTVTVAVPGPETLTLAVFGLLALAGLGSRRRNRR